MTNKHSRFDSLRIVSLMLALLISASAISCGSTSDQDTDTSADAQTSAPEDTTADDPRKNAKDDLPELDYKGETIRVLSRGGDYDTNIEFNVDEESGDVISDAVYNRNAMVEERLNLKIENIVTDTTRHGSNSGPIRQSVLAGSDDYDVIADALHSTMPLVLENMFFDLNKLDYINPSQPWWNQALSELSMITDGLYAITGQLSLTSISGVFCMFYNSDLFAEISNDDIYQVVKDGKWTLDKLHEYCTNSYRDLNGDTQNDQDDFYGLYVRDRQTLASDAFLGGARISAVETDGDGYKLSVINERTVEYAEKLKSLIYDSEATCRGEYNDDTIMHKMNNGTTVFLPWMLGAINDLREMEDNFGIIPIPKLNEEQSTYSSYTHNGSSVFAIPVTCQSPDRSSAFLEAMCAESYRSVVPAYYETAIKVKYSRDEPTAQMLDLIIDNIYLDVAYLYSSYLGEYVDIYRNMFLNAENCENIVSRLTARESAMNVKLGEIVEKYKELN